MLYREKKFSRPFFNSTSPPLPRSSSIDADDEASNDKVLFLAVPFAPFPPPSSALFSFFYAVLCVGFGHSVNMPSLFVCTSLRAG
jgi:hypothetical protein